MHYFVTCAHFWYRMGHCGIWAGILCDLCNSIAYGKTVSSTYKSIQWLIILWFQHILSFIYCIKMLAIFHVKYCIKVSSFVFITCMHPSHKSHNASDKYPRMYHFVTEMCTHVHISVTKWCILGFVRTIYRNRRTERSHMQKWYPWHFIFMRKNNNLKLVDMSHLLPSIVICNRTMSTFAWRAQMIPGKQGQWQIYNAADGGWSWQVISSHDIDKCGIVLLERESHQPAMFECKGMISNVNM